MAKGVHAALRAQVRVGAGLEVVIVTTRRTGCVKVAGRTRCIAAWTAVVKLTWRALALIRLAVAVACGTITTGGTIAKLLWAITIACWTLAVAVTAHMAIGTWCTAFGAGALTATSAAAASTTIATTSVVTFGVANALHHFAACGFGCRSHHVTAWGFT